jgi:hypothetical protein
MLKYRMTRNDALVLLGKPGAPASVQDAAAEIGVSVQSIYDWPEDLPQRIADRVQAAIARRLLPPVLIGDNDPKRTRQVGEEAANKA